MVRDFNNIDLAHVNKIKIKIENLFKIFGPKAKDFIQVVRDGTDKDDNLTVDSKSSISATEYLNIGSDALINVGSMIFLYRNKK